MTARAATIIRAISMNLDDAQRKKVIEWIGQGMKIAEIQTRLNSELGLRMTYMEVRLLVDDLKLVPKDAEPPKPSPMLAPPNPASKTAEPPAAPAPAAAPSDGGLSVSVDQLARPGAVVSGKVTFSDGTRCDWYLDQSGRLGLSGPQPGYRPPAADIPKFQAALDSELSRMGF